MSGDKWCVWLEDGSTFDSSQGEPTDVPKYPRLVCVAQTGQAAKLWGLCLTSGSVYFYRTDLACWTQHEEHGAMLEMIDHAEHIAACRAGKYIDTPTFKAMWAEARKFAGMDR